MRLAAPSLSILLLIACGSSSENTGNPDSSTDAVTDPTTDTDVDCPPIPPGCVDTCLDEEGMESHPWGNVARRCETVTDEHGCPELEFTNEDCRPGLCYMASGVEATCLPQIDCESATCTCPEGHRCHCAETDCVVTCEADCMVIQFGMGFTLECADGAWCSNTCVGSSCTMNCGTDGRCYQECGGGGDCDLNCDGASTCEQLCMAAPCHVECETAATCSQDCEAYPDCTCNGCP